MRFRVSSLEYCVDVGEPRGLLDAFHWWLDERVLLDLQTTSAVLRVTFKLQLEPLARRTDAPTGRDRGGILRGESRARSEAHQLGDGGVNMLGRDFLQCRADLW